MVHIGNHWDELLKEEFSSDYYQKIRKILKIEYTNHKVYPDMYHIFDALKLTDYPDVKVVILGQDPYFNPNQANGLAFSVQKGVTIPPSLRNIYKELNNDLGLNIPDHGDLTYWAEQGVLLLNATLTVRAGQASSHSQIGWQYLTNKIVELLNERDSLCFLLWGNHAIKKAAVIDRSKHMVHQTTHPSPLSASRGFLGSKPFSKANEFLVSVGKRPIDWQIR